MKDRIVRLLDRTKEQYWAQRILAELDYLQELTGVDGRLDASLRRLEDMFAASGAIGKEAALAEEAHLTSFGEQAKGLSLICAAHAHIDMNWMWGMPETTGIVIDTFQTMLNLMREYPAFVFTQSQASTYEIIAKYAPSMLGEIIQRIREGRWEVAATHWVEPDKNMISAESMARHLLYTKRYLSDLLEIDPDTLTIDFEPDTFGHPIGVPEALAQGGVKYMYHCRGNEQEEVYRWRSPSGSQVLVHRDPNWYNNAIEPGMCAFLPGFCRRNHVAVGLKVYGVGDHGGGPTRRDIERVLDMAAWPLMPAIRFGRLDEYFHHIEHNMAQFPVVERELNFVFTGCYTSQSRIKQANRFGEDHLYDSEALTSLSILAGCEAKPSADLSRAWKNVLFNHFHDILPGSGVRDTREYALGLFQEADSYAVGSGNRAMHALSGVIDTSLFGVGSKPEPESVAEGAGAGRGAMKGAILEHNGFSPAYTISDASRGAGDTRAYTLFNTTPYARADRVVLTIWDWDIPLAGTGVYDASGHDVPFDVVQENQRYWSHQFLRIAFTARVPAFGYTTCYLSCARQQKPAPYRENTRVHRVKGGNPVLENDILRAEFDACSLALHSLTDKRTGEELLSAPAGFCLAQEEDAGFYSAWVTGRFGSFRDLHRECFVSLTLRREGDLFGRLSYDMSFGNSRLAVTVTLDEDMLRFSTEVDWGEIGKAGMPAPRLLFRVPYAYRPACVRYDAAGGFIDRQETDGDVPALLYAAPVKEGGGIMLTTDCKYGYRAVGNTLQVALLRSSHSPDKLPETGVHHMELGIGAVTDFSWHTLTRKAMCFSHPIYVCSTTLHAGRMPGEASLLTLDGAARVTALKPGQDGGVLLRLHQNDTVPRPITIAPVHSARLTDALERVQHPLNALNGRLRMELDPWQQYSLLLDYTEANGDKSS